MMFRRAVAVGEIMRACEQVLEPHQCADSFVQRVLEENHGGETALKAVILPEGRGATYYRSNQRAPREARASSR